MFDFIIKGAMIADGSGAPLFRADLGIKNDIIAQIQTEINSEAKQVIQAYDRIIAPGFIDMHSHADCSAPFYPEMESPLIQGVTTVFTGHCGMGIAPIDRYYLEMFHEQDAISLVEPLLQRTHKVGFGRCVETDRMVPAFKKVFGVDVDWRSWGEYLEHLRKCKLGVNLAGVTGHSPIRHQIMGLDYKHYATNEQIRAMQELLARCMDEGSWGLGLGLDYSPGIYADRKELAALMSTVAERDGIVTAHVRMRNNYTDPQKPQYIIDGIDEFLGLGLKTGARIHISHIFSGYEVSPHSPKMDECSAAQTLELIEQYRNMGVKVTWDVLPKYTSSIFYNCQLSGKLTPYVAAAGGKKAFSKLLKYSSYRDDLTEEIRSGHHISGSPFVRIDPTADPDWDKKINITKSCINEYVGHTLREIADEMKIDGVAAMLELLSLDSEIYINKPYFRQETAGTDYFCRQPDATIGLDNMGFPLDYIVDKNDMPIEKTPPSAYCGMIKLLTYRLTDRIEETIRNMTGNAAKALRLCDRGFIKKDMAADIVILSPNELDANEDAVNPGQAPSGIDYVFVNGKIAVSHKKILNAKEGLILLRPM